MKEQLTSQLEKQQLFFSQNNHFRIEKKHDNLTQKKYKIISSNRKIISSKCSKLFWGIIWLFIHFVIVRASQINETINYQVLQSSIPLKQQDMNYIIEFNNSKKNFETNINLERDRLTIDNSLKHEIKYIRKSQRKSRSPSTCTLSEDSLIGLKKVIDNTLIKENITCSYNSDIPGCFELIKYIICGARHLKSEFVQASINANLNEVAQLKIKLDDLSRKKLTIKDDVKRDEIQKHQKNLANLTEQLQKDQSELKKLTFQLEILESLWFDETSNYAVLADVDTAFLPTIPKVVNKRQKCTLLEEEIFALKKGIENLITKVGEFQGQVSDCKHNYLNCNEMIKFIKCEVNHLSSGLKEVKNKGNLNEVTELKKKISDLEKEIDNLTEKVKQEQFEKVKNQYLNQSSESNRIREEIVKATLKLCISEISKGMIENASIHFENLKDDNKIDQVLKSVYNDYGQLNQLKNIVNFIKKLPRCSQHAQAFSFLFEMIKSRKHFDHPIILSVFNSMKCFSDCIGNQTLQQLKTDLVTNLANNIRIGNFDLIISFARESGSNSNILNDYLPEIVKHTYSNNLANFEKTLKFIEDLPWLLHWFEGYNSLFYTMKNNCHLDSRQFVKLAHRVKEAINQPNEDSVINQLKKAFVNLKNQFPKGVLAIL